MSRVSFSNPSLWSIYMVDFLIHMQEMVESFEIKKSQQEEVYSAANSTNSVGLKTKGALNTDIPKCGLTTGLPK